jgi:hypothetical protein
MAVQLLPASRLRQSRCTSPVKPKGVDGVRPPGVDSQSAVEVLAGADPAPTHSAVLAAQEAEPVGRGVEEERALGVSQELGDLRTPQPPVGGDETLSAAALHPDAERTRRGVERLRAAGTGQESLHEAGVRDAGHLRPGPPPISGAEDSARPQARGGVGAARRHPGPAGVERMGDDGVRFRLKPRSRALPRLPQGQGSPDAVRRRGVDPLPLHGHGAGVGLLPTLPGAPPI